MKILPPFWFGTKKFCVLGDPHYLNSWNIKNFQRLFLVICHFQRQSKIVWFKIVTRGEGVATSAPQVCRHVPSGLDPIPSLTGGRHDRLLFCGGFSGILGLFFFSAYSLDM